jgi:hypothetical protein
VVDQQTNQVAKREFLAPVLAAALLLFTLGVSLPATLYLTNAGEFTIAVGDLLLVAIPAFLVALAFAASLIHFVRVLQRPRIVALLFALAVLVWFQGNVLVWQYGPLDGRAIDWSAHRINGVIDGFIWIAGLLAAIRWPLPISRMAPLVATVLLSLQAVLLLITGVQAAGAAVPGTIKDYEIDESSKYSFSRERNAILVVLDETQSDVFAEILEADETYARVFDGFTYFPDAVAASNFTELAVPALLTGRLYDNSIPKDQYMKEAFLGDSSLLATLKRSGYHVEIFPWVGWGNESIFFDDTIADNLKSVTDARVQKEVFLSEKKAREIVHLLDLSVFRSVPHFIKPHVHKDQRWLLMDLISNVVPDDVKQVISADDDQFETSVFATQANDRLRADRRGNVFKFYHLKGAHAPLTVDADLRTGNTQVPFTRENYVRQLQASLRGLETFFSALRRAGIYDTSLIVVAGDHGSGSIQELHVNSPGDRPPTSRVPAGASARNFREDKARGIPLVLVKRIEATGPMTVSSYPVSVMDIPATIVEELGLGQAQSRMSMFDPGRRTGRVRQYAAFDNVVRGDRSRPKERFLDDRRCAPRACSSDDDQAITVNR